jgi:flagellar motor switch protein FliM
MAGILSQEEVDALIHGLNEGKLATADEAASPVGYKPYDLTAHERIIRGKMPTLEIINEKFSRLYRTSLQAILRRVVNITTMATTIIKFHQYLNSLPVPSSIQVIRLEPMRGSAILVIDSRLIFTFIDIILGGTGRTSYKVEGREFTAIENNMIKRFVTKALEDFESAWSVVVKLSAIYQKTEINPQFALITLPTDPVVVMTFLIELENVSGKMTICIPYSTLEPFREKLNSRFQAEQSENELIWASRLKANLLLSSINLAVEVGRATLPGRDILNLKKGDVIVLDKHYQDYFNVMAENSIKFRAVPGLYKGNNAVKISEVVTPGEVVINGED